jgi:predicted GNAT family N-acyltransferase
MIKAITVRYDSQYIAKIRNIRHRVFSVEQGIDREADFDGRDGEAVHALIQISGEYVATGRMLMDGHIGRLAVLKSWRGKGLGRMIVEALTAEAGNRGIARVFLGAQKQAEGFYQKIGFRQFGEPFMEVGIEHVHMEKIL